MFQVVSMVARPKPPPISAAAVGLPAFTALYSKCWAARPTERWVDDNVRYFLIGNYFLTIWFKDSRKHYSTFQSSCCRPSMEIVAKNVKSMGCHTPTFQLRNLRWLLYFSSYLRRHISGSLLRYVCISIYILLKIMSAKKVSICLFIDISNHGIRYRLLDPRLENLRYIIKLFACFNIQPDLPDWH